MARLARISEVLVVQGNNQGGGLAVPESLIGVTVECTPDSANDVWIGWNENATNKNILTPGDSKDYGSIEGFFLDGNKLYISFDPTNTGGKALVTWLIDAGEC